MSHSALNTKWLGFEVAFSIVVSALIANIALIARIKFGQMQVTHLTLQPYLISLAICIVLLVEVVGFLYLGNITLGGDYLKLVSKSVEIPGYIAFFGACAATKYALMMIFVLARTFEQESLLFFIFFQERFRI